VLTLGVPALNRMIESLTQADHIETLITRGAKIAQTAQAGLDAVGSAVDLTEAEQEIQNWKAEVERVRAEFTRVSTSTDTIQTQLRSLEAMQTAQLARNEKILFARADRRQREAIMTTLDEIKTKLAALKVDDLEDLNTELESLNGHYIALYNNQNELKNAQASLTRLEQWFETTGAKWEEQEANIPFLESARNTYEEAQQANATAKAAFDQAISDHESKKKAHTAGVCVACNRVFENHDQAESLKAVEAAAEVVKTTSAALVRTQGDLAAMRAEVARLEAVQPPAGYEDTYKAKEAERTTLQEFVAQSFPLQLAANLDAARKAVEIQQGKVATAKAAAITARDLKQKQETQRVQLQTLEKSLADAPAGEPEDTAPLTAEITAVRSAYYLGNKQVGEAQQVVSDAQAEMKAWENVLAAGKTLNEKRASLEKRAKRFDEVVAWLRKSKNAFLGKIWDQITLISSETVTNATMGYATSLCRTDDGEFMVIEDGEEVPMISASGGMSSICGVSLRMALDSVLSQSVGFVVLDEPSSELNDEHAASLAGALRAGDRQVILVTHRSGEEFVSAGTRAWHANPVHAIPGDLQ
jgi:chromosome segregation ATPase